MNATVEGTLDSLPGYLRDIAHDRDLPVYAEVGCTGRVFIDSRGVRVQKIEMLQLAAPAPLSPDHGLHAEAVTELSARYRILVCGPGAVPGWVVANLMPQCPPPENAAVDLDALAASLLKRSPRTLPRRR